MPRLARRGAAVKEVRAVRRGLSWTREAVRWLSLGERTVFRFWCFTEEGIVNKL